MAENEKKPDAAPLDADAPTLLSPLSKHDAPSRLGYGRSRIEKLLEESRLNYEVLSFIGRGSYGEVWLLRDRALRRLAAIKVIDKTALGENWRREFEGVQTYAEHVASHPNLLSVYQAVDMQDYFFYIMEGADNIGPSVDQYIPDTLNSRLHAYFAKKQTMPLGQVRRLMEDLCDGIEVLHQRHLLHRDIKPGNVIFVNGKAKLTDMGCVTTQGLESEAVGTPGFIPKDPTLPQDSAMRDLYALAMVLYVCVTGFVPERFPELPAGFLQNARLARLNRFLLRVGDPARSDIRTIQEFRTELKHAFKPFANLRVYLTWTLCFLLGGLTVDLILETPPDSENQLPKPAPAATRAGSTSQSPAASTAGAAIRPPAAPEAFSDHPMFEGTTNLDLAIAARDFLTVGGAFTNTTNAVTWRVTDTNAFPASLFLRFPSLELPAEMEISFTLEGELPSGSLNFLLYPAGGEDEEVLNRQHWPFLSLIRCAFGLSAAGGSGCRIASILGADHPSTHFFRPSIQLLGTAEAPSRHVITRAGGIVTYQVNDDTVLSGPVGPRPDKCFILVFQTAFLGHVTLRDFAIKNRYGNTQNGLVH